MYPAACKQMSAIGRSRLVPNFGRPAGARLMRICPFGGRSPYFANAPMTLPCTSLMAPAPCQLCLFPRTKKFRVQERNEPVTRFGALRRRREFLHRAYALPSRVWLHCDSSCQIPVSRLPGPGAGELTALLGGLRAGRQLYFSHGRYATKKQPVPQCMSPARGNDPSALEPRPVAPRGLGLSDAWRRSWLTAFTSMPKFARSNKGHSCIQVEPFWVAYIAWKPAPD